MGCSLFCIQKNANHPLQKGEKCQNLFERGKHESELKWSNFSIWWQVKELSLKHIAKNALNECPTHSQLSQTLVNIRFWQFGEQKNY